MEKDFFQRMEETTGVSLNAVQKEAVLHSEGALLLLASPGSGKTTTLNMKIGYLLLEKKIQADRIMAITFSKASALDMSERFDRFFSKLTDQKVHFSTIHSFAYQVVREYFRKQKQQYQLVEGNISEEELEKDFDNENEMPLHKKLILRNLFQKINGEKPTDDDMDELQTFIGFVKNRMITGRNLAKVKTNVKNAIQIFEAYEEFKVKDPSKILLDFDDMLTYCYNILEEDEEIRSKYQQQFEYILTDESQDNSIVQHLIVEVLAKPQNNICVVADDDQSIFMWRGSDVNKLLQFEDIYPNAKVLTMSQNYRSSQEIVATANQFIKRNKNRYEKEMFTENPSHEPIVIKNLYNYEAQLKYIAEEIKKRGNYKEIAVLYRNNSSAIPLVNELERAGIPFYMKDMDTKFFKHWIVEDILNFMRLSYKDSRVDILEKIHTKFNAYITKHQIQFLKTFTNGASVFDNLMTGKIATYQEKAIPKAKRIFERLNKMKPENAILTIRDELGYDNAIKKMCDTLGFNKEYLMGILNTLESIARDLDTLEEFALRLKELEELMKTSKFNKNKDVITLTTFHSSKGLEYDTVYMIDLINGVIPSHDDIKAYRNQEVELMEEAVRLFYVGMTRARKHLELLTYEHKDGEKVTESLFVQDVKRIVHPVHKKSLQEKAKVDEIPIVSKDTLLRQKDMVVGERVLHKKFGLGLIVEVKENTIGITFDNVGFKTFMADFCLKNGLLQKATDQVLEEYKKRLTS